MPPPHAPTWEQALACLDGRPVAAPAAPQEALVREGGCDLHSPGRQGVRHALPGTWHAKRSMCSSRTGSAAGGSVVHRTMLISARLRTSGMTRSTARHSACERSSFRAAYSALRGRKGTFFWWVDGSHARRAGTGTHPSSWPAQAVSGGCSSAHLLRSKPSQISYGSLAGCSSKPRLCQHPHRAAAASKAAAAQAAAAGGSCSAGSCSASHSRREPRACPQGPGMGR